MDLFRTEVAILEEVVKSGSMSAAAEALGLRQPAVSKAIKRLERDSGAGLLTRGREGVALTVQGKKLLNAVTAARGAIKLAPKLGEKLPTLSIGCHAALAFDFFPELLPALQLHFSQTELSFQLAPSLEVTRRVAAGEVDIGLVVNPVRRRQLVVRSLRKDYVALWESERSRADATVMLHPDMLYAPHVSQLFQGEFWKVADYEVIAWLVKSGYRGLLPGATAQRHGLKMVGKKLFEVQISLITHEERFDKTLLRKLTQVVQDSIPN